MQTPFDCHKFSRKFINDDENESKNIILFADKRPRERANKKNKNLQKSAIKKPTNLTNNTNPLKLSTPLPMQGGLGVGLPWHPYDTPDTLQNRVQAQCLSAF